MQKDREASFQPRETRFVPKKKSHVSCMICQAAYVPSRQRSDLLQASPLALESAFMSMCHFCFRCRRPSCPECWDYVHGICASCSQDANLPFRTEVPPLNGALLSPLREAQSFRERQISSPLVCIRPGIYVQSRLVPIDKITTRPELPLSLQVKASPPSALSPKPAMEITRKTFNAQPDRTELKTRPASKPALGAIRTILNVFIWLLFFALLFILILVALALFSTSINSSVLAIIHIDIRLEIAHLLRFFRQFFP